MGTEKNSGLRKLTVGESADNLPIVEARKCWSNSGLRLKAGQSYEFKVEDVQNWRDWYIPSDPQVGHLEPQWLLKPFTWARRYRKANWYTLVGSVGKSPHSYFPIREGRSYTPDTTGELFSFANDAYGFYWNNHGTLRLTVTRLS